MLSKEYPDDTIVAPSTPAGTGALAIIRVSGPAVPELCTQLFPDSSLPPRKAVFLPLHSEDGQLLDSVIAIRYKKPRSFTGEDSLELVCHGNPLIVTRIIEDMVARGCRFAQPGEFTRTAFLNGKLDLTQAEAVHELITARSARALDAAHRQLRGHLGDSIQALSHDLLQITAHLEAYIDFPEEDLPPEDAAGPLKDLLNLRQKISQIIASQQDKRFLEEGVRCAIVGEPNSGKSSLLNCLLGEERSIVTPTPGTTRDYIVAPLLISPHLLQLVDTAGIHSTQDPLERMGIDQSMRQGATADMLLFVIDQSIPPPQMPGNFSDLLDNHPTLLVLNKNDLPAHRDCAGFLPNFPKVSVSSTLPHGMDQLKRHIVSLIDQSLSHYDDASVLVSARHADALRESIQSIDLAIDGLRSNLPAELVASELHLAMQALHRITGKVDSESMLDELFHSFCIGK